MMMADEIDASKHITSVAAGKKVQDSNKEV